MCLQPIASYIRLGQAVLMKRQGGAAPKKSATKSKAAKDGATAGTKKAKDKHRSIIAGSSSSSISTSSFSSNNSTSSLYGASKSSRSSQEKDSDSRVRDSKKDTSSSCASSEVTKPGSVAWEIKMKSGTAEEQARRRRVLPYNRQAHEKVNSLQLPGIPTRAPRGETERRIKAQQERTKSSVDDAARARREEALRRRGGPLFHFLPSTSAFDSASPPPFRPFRPVRPTRLQLYQKIAFRRIALAQRAMKEKEGLTEAQVDPRGIKERKVLDLKRWYVY